QTARLATEAGAMVISHLRNRGKGVALRTGFAFALQQGYDAVVTMDSDGQHDPEEIPRLLQASEEPHAAIVIGHRLLDNAHMPRIRRWTNWFMSSVVSLLTRQQIPDSQCGFRVIRRHVLDALRLSGRRFDLETELLLAAARRGWRVSSVPIRAIYHDHASYIHPIMDGVRFVGLVLRYLPWALVRPPQMTNTWPHGVDSSSASRGEAPRQEPPLPSPRLPPVSGPTQAGSDGQT
ncbi:MAG: glycosyltransferase family 2 protein, partial [Candidatus Omnitrophica bacterium]|nr:glycosyltransferase family 2 protein [Candidatus Omnitrophota bacterium]